MADPITMAVVGSMAGAAMSPKDPLKGALLGAVGGYGGGAMLGAAGVGAAGSTAAGAAGTGLSAAGGTLAPGIGSAVGAGGSAIGGASGLAAPAFTGVGLTPAATGMAAGQASLAAAPSMVAPTLGTGAAAASPFSSAMQYMKENPMIAGKGLDAAQGLLMPEQQPMAPSAGLMRGQIAPQQMAPYSMARPQISLI